MAAINVTSYCKRWAELNGIDYADVNTSHLKLSLIGGPEYSKITPEQCTGPIVAKMRADPRRNTFMQVTPKTQAVTVDINITKNGLKGLNKLLHIPGPRGSIFTQGFPVDIGKPTQTHGPVSEARALVNSESTENGTCVRLKHSEIEVDVTIRVSISGKVIFRRRHGGPLEISFDRIIEDLKGYKDETEKTKRFNEVNPTNGSKFVVTVKGNCFFRLTSG